jgi:phospholipid/cholesterol/gamma-HCH transport system substrate-binding protein
MSDGPRKRRSNPVEGYWKRLKFERDPQREAERMERIRQADEGRRARQAADAARGPGRHHERLGRQIRGRLTDVLALSLLIVLGLTTAFVIISNQKASLPGWVPVLGQDFFHLDAEFETGQALMPGQGQAVTISGIRVGAVESVNLEDGNAVVGLDIEPKYAKLIHPDATLLMRPKTGLNDMVVEVDPGTEPGQVSEDATIPQAQTLPNVNPDEIWRNLDGDTRAYLQLLLQGGAEGLGGEVRGRRLSHVFRRFTPFARDIARINTAVAKRRDNLARVIHNFRLLTEELAAHDSELTRFVTESDDALGAFANQSASIRESLRLLPPTLRQTNAALQSSDRLSTLMKPALTKLIPQAQAFGPAMRAVQRFSLATLPAMRDQVRPFVSEVKPAVREFAPAGKPFGTTVTGFRDTIKPLNYGFNEFAYDPPGELNQSYLFHTAWLNHNLNATYLTQDAEGPIRRGVILLSCNTADLANGFAGGRPFLRTLLQVTRAPTEDEAC